MDIHCKTGALSVCCDKACDAARNDAYNYGCDVEHNDAYYNECDVGSDNAYDNTCNVARYTYDNACDVAYDNACDVGCDVAYDDTCVLCDVAYMTMRPMLRAMLLMIILISLMSELLRAMKPRFSSARIQTRCWVLLGVAILLLFDEMEISIMLSSMLNFIHLHLLVIVTL